MRVIGLAGWSGAGKNGALVRELREEPEAPLAELLQRLSPVDLVVVEGFKAERHPKIEVHRTANGKPFLFPEIPNVKAIAADPPVPDAPIPVVPLDAVDQVADLIDSVAEPLDALLGRLSDKAR